MANREILCVFSSALMTADEIYEFSKALNLPDKMFREYVIALYSENKLGRLRNHLSEDMYLKLSITVRRYIERRQGSAEKDACLARPKESPVSSSQMCAARRDVCEKDDMHAAEARKTRLGHIDFSGTGANKPRVHTFKLSRGETIASLKELILSLTTLHDVICIRGDTGCGKSTLIPQFLLDKFHRVICTQPRRIAAISIAKYVKRTLGATVGYKVRFEEDICDRTRLIYVTDGILLKNNLQSDMLVVDEAHERTVNIDILMAMKRKMVIMSATLSDEVVNFFRCPLINIEVERFHVEVFYLRCEADDYLKETVETAEMLCTGTEYRGIVAKRSCSSESIAIFSKELDVGDGCVNGSGDMRSYHSACTSRKTGDVLVFLPGHEEISYAYRSLKRSLSYSHLIIPLHSSSQSPDVFAPSTKPKIILATNIAETSITLDVDYVIDSGYFKQKTFMQIDTLFVARISKSQARQRAGRVGRVREGTVYRIYSKKEFDAFQECVDPEILRINLCNVVLLLTSLGVFYTSLVTSLPEDRLAEALNFLESIGALKNGVLTSDGKKMSTLPVHVQCAKTLIVANRLSVLENAATIISMLSVSNIIKGEFLGFRAGVDINVMRKYEDAQGDHYTLLNIYRKWADQHYSSRFLETNGMNVKNMHQVRRVREQLIAYFRPVKVCTLLDMQKHTEHRIEADLDGYTFCKRRCSSFQDGDIYYQEKDEIMGTRRSIHGESCSRHDNVSQAFLEGFKHNIARKRGDAYITVGEGKQCYIHPSSVLYGRTPEYILFNDLVMTKKEYMRWCMTLDSKSFSAVKGYEFV